MMLCNAEPVCPICGLPLMVSRGLLRCPGCVYAEPLGGYPEPTKDEKEDSDG